MSQLERELFSEGSGDLEVLLLSWVYKAAADRQPSLPAPCTRMMTTPPQLMPGARYPPLVSSASASESD